MIPTEFWLCAGGFLLAGGILLGIGVGTWVYTRGIKVGLRLRDIEAFGGTEIKDDEVGTEAPSHTGRYEDDDVT